MGRSGNGEDKPAGRKQKKLMDFDFSEDQIELSNLAKTIFSDLSTSDRVAEVERTDQRFDKNLWEALADAGPVSYTHLTLPTTPYV